VAPGPVTIRFPAGKVQVYAAPEAGE